MSDLLRLPQTGAIVFALGLLFWLAGLPAGMAASGTAERSFKAYLTGYSYWDNTPPGSADISKPVVHARAGGVGTFDDPITIAVGHAIRGGRQFLDYPPGTRFYISSLRKYAVVEDVCGDGPTPQNGPCHTGHQGLPWLDIYVDGAHVGRSAAQKCANRITAVHVLIEHPDPGYPVAAGAISESGCRRYP